MHNLENFTALIAGGTGTVGEAIVRVFLECSAKVIVPSRSQQALNRLREFLADVPCDRLTMLVGDLSDEADAARLRDEIAATCGPIDGVVASLGGTWEENKKLVDVPMDTWRRYADGNLTAHFVTAKTFLPVLATRPGSSYTLLGGLSAVMPVANYSVVSINSAAQLMMARILQEEMKQTAVRINQVMFGYISTRARAKYAKPEWVTAEEVGQVCAWLASPAARMIAGGVLQLGNRPPRTVAQDV